MKIESRRLICERCCGSELLKLLEKVAVQRDIESVTLSTAAHSALNASRAHFEWLRDSGAAIYGVTTGYGALVGYAQHPNANGGGLLAHLGVGYGQPLPPRLLRAAILLRTETLLAAHSAVRPATLERYLQLLLRNDEELPHCSEIGSVGASGDLVPLAQLASALDATTLDGREALALTNGLSFSRAAAAFALLHSERLLAHAEQLTALLFAALGASAEPLDARLHPNATESLSAERIRLHLTAATAAVNETPPSLERPLQEPYSLRCAVQIFGAAAAQIDAQRRELECEIERIDDNPLIFAPEKVREGKTAGEPQVVHGGNFHGQRIAFLSDILNMVQCELAIVAERQLDLLLDPERNNRLPPLLAARPGVDSGLAGAQLTATALVAEMRSAAQMHSTSSIPTNGRNQDVVSMSFLAARRAGEQSERLAGTLAILALAIAQHAALSGRKIRLPDYLRRFQPLERDRPLREEIDAASRYLLNTSCHSSV